MTILYLFIVALSICNGQTIVEPTTSDSSGEYYIAEEGNNFNRSEIQCGSNVACFIECDIDNSCQETIINCGSASICDIKCSGNNACSDLSIYTSPDNTNISCSYWWSCDGTMTLYTDYTNYPSSYTEIDCLGYSSCDYIEIKDATTEEDNYDALTADRFKIYCQSCRFEGYFSGITNPTAIPSITNETGEYYFDAGSLVDFECNTDKLCYIDCSDASCSQSNINCGPAEECTIFCGEDNGCDYLDITAIGMDQFNFICPETSNCGWSDFNLTNIDTVNITCIQTNSCPGNDYYINSVRDLNVFCDFYWSCGFEDWYLTDIENAVIVCDGSCHDTTWVLNNVGYQKFDCIGDVTNPYLKQETCDDVAINAVNTQQIDMLCEYEDACHDITICTDGIFHLECVGNNTCNPLNLCNATAKSDDTNIVYTYKETEPPTTAQPSQNPTTAKPSESPTTAQPTAPTENPTTAQPTAPTTEPTEQPTRGRGGPLDPNAGNILIAVNGMVMVVIVILLQIM